MRWVSYTRAVSCRKGEENPPDIISRQNETIEAYMKELGFSVIKTYSDREFSPEASEGFDELVRAGMRRDFDGVVVDSVFRCGRALHAAIEILHKTFYPVGIQFAVAEDHFCSMGKTPDEVTAYFFEKRCLRAKDRMFAKLGYSEGDTALAYKQVRYGYKLSDDSLMSTLRFVFHSHETFITIGLPNKSSIIEVLRFGAFRAAKFMCFPLALTLKSKTFFVR